MSITIHKSMLGTTCHLLSESEGFVFVNKVPDNSWTIGDASSRRRIEELSKLFDEPLPILADLAHIASLESLNLPSDAVIPWHFVLSKNNFNSRVDRLLTVAEGLKQQISLSGYETLLIQHKTFLAEIEPLSIDSHILNSKIAESADNPSRLSCLKSFSPAQGDFALPIVYTQESTVTGRLTVDSGPKILTLPSDTREIIKSRYAGGKVYSVDFVSLEPRVIKCVVSEDPVPADIYQHVQTLIEDSSLPRGEVKKLIIACIYGASKNRLHEMAKSSNISKITRVINDYFGIEELNKRLEECQLKFGHIVNYFGRPIIDEKSDKHTWLSHYAQSTAVDVALDAFYTLAGNLKDTDNRIVPVALIHDAVLFDVPPTADAAFKASTDKLLQTRLGLFPVSRTQINRRNNV